MFLNFLKPKQATKLMPGINSKEKRGGLMIGVRLGMIRLENVLILILRNLFKLEEILWNTGSSERTPWIAPDSLKEGVHAIPRESESERGDVPGWVLVVLMTAGLVTGIWTVAAPRLNLILRNSLDSMNAIR